MTVKPEIRQRLAQLMDERRLDLDLTWQEVAEKGGVSLRAVSSARTGPGEIRPLTRRGIDRGLQWVPGKGVDAILEGRDPVPAGGGLTRPVTMEDLAGPPKGFLGMSDELRAAVQPLVQRIAEQAVMLRADVRTPPPGAAMFSDKREATSWDLLAANAETVAWVVWGQALLQFRDRERDERANHQAAGH